MSAFKEMVAADLDVFFNTDEHAETVQYNGVDIPAVVEYSPRDDADAVGETAYLWVLDSDVPSPAYRDTCVIDGVTWYVQRGPFSRNDGNTWRLPILSQERPVI